MPTVLVLKLKITNCTADYACARRLFNWLKRTPPAETEPGPWRLKPPSVAVDGLGMGLRIALILGTLVVAYAVQAATHSHTAFVVVIGAGLVLRIVLRLAG